jgi:hypothetical protein
LIAAAGAAAQNTCYRVVDAADLGSLPVGDRQVPGINPSGEIVGSYYVDGQWHAFLWLPDENPNYPDSRLSVGLNDLHVLADNGQGLGPGDSAARDINSAGKVVGQAGVLDLETVGGRAFILDLTQEGIPLIPMAIPNPTQSHGAWAVNDASPYQVVGHYTSTATCPPNPALLLRRGFVWDSGKGVVEPLVPPGDLDHAAGFGVNTPAPGSASVVVGDGDGCGPEPPCPLLITRQTAWQNGAPITLAEPAGFVDSQGQALDANEQHMVGWSTVPGGGADCPDYAVLWESPGSPVNLHSGPNVTNPLPPDHESHADGMNNLVPPQIVGLDKAANLALLWEKMGSDWTIVSLTDILGRCSVPPFDGEWAILRAHDVNDSGWIVAWADLHAGGPTQVHAVLLAPNVDCPPTTCNEDIAGPEGGPPDCHVGTDDFLAMLAQWGPCPGLDAPCRADFDCSGRVNVQDHLRLLSNWGPCPECDGAGGAGSPAALEEALVVLGFAGLDAFGAWLAEASEPEVATVADLLDVLLPD